MDAISAVFSLDILKMNVYNGSTFSQSQKVSIVRIVSSRRITLVVKFLQTIMLLA